MKTIKKYLTHIFGIFFLGYLNILFYRLGHNNDKQMMILFILELLIVIGCIVEMIYFIIKAAKTKELKNKALHCILIYLFNIFYIPCFSLKHIYKDANYKIKNILYLIITIILYILLNINIISAVTSESPKTYTSNDNSVTLTISDRFKKDESTSYDLYFAKNDMDFGLYINDNTSYTSNDLLNKYKEEILEAMKEPKELSNTNHNIKDRSINTVVYSGIFNNKDYVFSISSIESTKRNNYIVIVIEACLNKNYSSTSKEMEEILNSIVIN